MPTVTIGDNSTDDHAGSEVVELIGSSPTTNNSTGTTVELININRASGVPRVGLFRFTGLTSITGPVTVSAATLWLYKVAEAPSFYNPTMRARRVIRDWVASQATWNVWSTGNSWTTAGAQSDGNDRVATPTGEQSDIGSTLNTYHGLPLDPAEVQDIINGVITNRGWVVDVESDSGGTGTDYWRLATDEGTDGLRPYLEVTYEAASSAAEPIVVWF